ncbi:MAG: DUF4258 domain-containing protein [Verrucomicrobia bacterium]|nr:DUF4258 domain-containing protein [Verrucomicrobiota bacterium]
MKPVYFSHHVAQRMIERGTNRQELERAIRHGRQVPAKAGKVAFRLNLRFEQIWKGKYYGTKQVMAVVSEKADRFVVVTALTFYF